MTVNLPILLCLFHVALLCVFAEDRVQMTWNRNQSLIHQSANTSYLYQPSLANVKIKRRQKCQDSFTGPTGARAERGLAKVIILDNDSDIPVPCRRSILTCSGCYKCAFAAADFLDDCKRWDATDAPHVPISGPIMDAKTAEAESVAAVASAFYRSVKDSFCKGKFLDANDICRGQAILRKFSTRSMGKTYFVGCAKWKHSDSDLMSKCHRFTEIPAALTKHQCNAQLSILVPIDKHDLRAVIIPAAGIPHTHPSFPRTKISSAMKQKCQQCIDATGGVGATTLRIDKSSSTLLILDGKLLQDLHPGMIIGRKSIAFQTQILRSVYRDFHRQTVTGLGTVIGRVWSNGASCGAFVMVWNGIFDAIKTITWKKLNFKPFSPRSKLLRMIGDSEGAQAQGLADVIILRGMNPLTVGKIVTTCIVHFNRILTRSARGVFSLKAYISESDLEYLLGFPYLCSDEKIQAYYTFCADSTIAKVQTLRRDTNPIKGSHAQDNQVNSTRCPLLEAIILEKKLDSDTAQVIKAAMVSGVLENPHNSLETRYKSQSQCKARGWEKQLELHSLTGREAKKLQDRARSGEEQAKANELEIIRLRQQIEALTHGANLQPATPPRQLVAGPSRLNYCRCE
ncbi:hypothetical protein C8R43DRAFT_944427 [Mycena crocata]|nr:hypothetical protein C8R43DRAFT_944427 [Mycena crocata]